MSAFRCLADSLSRAVSCVALCGLVSLAPLGARAQSPVAPTGDAHDFVQSVVNSELAADAKDHSLWMFRDANKVPGRNTVKLTVETTQGDVSKTIEMAGQPLTPQQQAADKQARHRFVTDPATRQKQKQGQQQDDKKAAAMTKMLPDAFLWTKTGESGDETTLAFQPNPKFNPPTREARVFAAMKGTMVVDTKQKRIKSLEGTLIRNVNFGFGLLGKLQKGGTFHVERQEVGPKVWEITSTHVHIHGHALIFRSISEDQDEEQSHFQPSPPSITPAQAAKMLEDGTVAKKLGIVQSK